MNISKFTQKSQEAVQLSQKIALENGNQQIDQEHLAAALMEVEDSLIANLVTKMGIQKEAFAGEINTLIGKLPKVSGASGQEYLTVDMNKVLTGAEDEAKAMGDDYVSVEHLFLCMLRNPNRAMKELFRNYGITRERFLQALSTVRGNQRVTSDNPEATYDTLNKYGSDLVERARDQKLDPVIGRDDEIRNVIRILSRKTKNREQECWKKHRAMRCRTTEDSPTKKQFFWMSGSGQWRPPLRGCSLRSRLWRPACTHIFSLWRLPSYPNSSLFCLF